MIVMSVAPPEVCRRCTGQFGDCRRGDCLEWRRQQDIERGVERLRERPDLLPSLPEWWD